MIEMPQTLNLPIKLKELTFKRCACCYEAQKQNFLKLFELQEKSLEKIVFHQPNMPLVYQQILTRFENLKSLYLDGSRLSQSVSFYSGFRKIKRMRHLVLDNGLQKHEVAKSFHRLFPNLESLKLSSKIRGWTKNFLKTIVKLHPNLESLSFCEFSSFTGNSLIQNLKSFEFEEIYSSGLDLVMRHRTLVTLKFGKLQQQPAFYR